jgi:4-hydroxythreonine-4-phosphate dehydrogenase
VEKLRQSSSSAIAFRKIKNTADVSFDKNTIHVVECPASRRIGVGRKSAESGKASLDYLNKAIDFAISGKIEAIATAPLSKAAVRLSGEVDFVGHTEHLAEKTNTRTCAMMFYSRKLKVVLVTTHLPLREVADAISTQKIVRATSLANEALKKLGLSLPRIGIAALNPHAGEEEAFGDEDKRIVAPAVRHGRKLRMNVEGPFPADTLFHAAYSGSYDLVVAMYHDQALAPFKMIAFDTGVNITLGLPFVRTSVDHGTAFDIAGKGMASEKSLVEAIKLAARMAQ